MIVTIRQREYDLNEKDYCIFNGACYILMTRQYFKDLGYVHPTFPKTLMKKMLKEGTAYQTEERWRSTFGGSTETFPVIRFREKE